MDNKKLQSGFSLIIVMIMALIILVLGGTILFSSFLNNSDLKTQISSRPLQNSPLPSAAANNQDLSNSTDLEVLEMEFEDTVIDGFESDLLELEETASTL